MSVNPKLSASPRTASLHQPVPCRFSCSTSGIPTQPSHLPDQCNGEILLLLPRDVNHRLVLLPPKSEVLLFLLWCRPTLQLQLNALDHLQPDRGWALGIVHPCVKPMFRVRTLHVRVAREAGGAPPSPEILMSNFFGVIGTCWYCTPHLHQALCARSQRV